MVDAKIHSGFSPITDAQGQVLVWKLKIGYYVLESVVTAAGCLNPMISVENNFSHIFVMRPNLIGATSGDEYVIPWLQVRAWFYGPNDHFRPLTELIGTKQTLLCTDSVIIAPYPARRWKMLIGDQYKLAMRTLTGVDARSATEIDLNHLDVAVRAKYLTALDQALVYNNLIRRS